MGTDYDAFFDELEKIAEATKPAITKERLRKGLSIAGGVGATTGGAIAAFRGLRHLRKQKAPMEKVLAGKPGLVKALKKYGPYGLMAAGAGVAMASRNMRSKIDKEYAKTK